VKLVAVAVVVAIAAVLARFLQSRKPQAPTQPKMEVPAQVDRRDFAQPEVEWLVAVFSSATCSTCIDVVAKAEALATAQVAVVNVEYPEHKDLHDRYGIDAVPTVVVADAQGVVRGSFIGPVTATDLWAGVAEMRQPGSRAISDCATSPVEEVD
jgi:thioredoxin-like negative regulator of GroEL